MSSSDRKGIKEFPDLTNKLAAPAKKSVFERQKAEAEAKKAREEAETAAVYEDFIKSFEQDGAEDSPARANSRQDPSSRSSFSAAHSGPRLPAGPPKRHFAPGGRSSGPGSLGPPPNLARKRAFDELHLQEKNDERGLLAFDDGKHVDAASAFRTSDDEDEKHEQGGEAERAAPRPTLQLSSLPPGTSPAVIKSLIPSNLKVDAVRIVSPPGPGSAQSTERRAMAAIVTLASDTPASEIDAAVSSLQNKYLGWGYNLSLSRHLSSAALGALSTTTPALNSGLASLPFGATAPTTRAGPSLSRAPPPSELHRGGFVPPSSYGSGYQTRYDPRGQQLQVKVAPPSDIKQLKLIHKTVEALLTHGPEFEALLMSRPEVQREEKWAWIWNPRSPGGVWYRWRLWEILTGVKSRTSSRNHYGEALHRVFDGAAPWMEPDDTLPFEFSTQLDELVSDSDYNSSDEDDSGDEGPTRKRRRQMAENSLAAREGAQPSAGDEQTYLNPLQKAKLTHLLARLPTTTAKLRKGDVARVTAFAIAHASQGAEEVVDMLVDNISRPVAWSKTANPEPKSLNKEEDEPMTEGKDENPPNGLSDKKENTKDDTSSSALIALHLISDILSASSTSGVRHAWRYRTLFENSLATRKVFSYLGRIEKLLGWGRLRADKWRRSIGTIMQLWEGWCVFPADRHASFAEEFAHPALTEEEIREEEEKKRSEREGTGGAKETAKSRWKAVDRNEISAEGREDVNIMNVEALDTNKEVDGKPVDDLNGEPMEDVDGEPMEDLDGEPMEDLDGEPMEDSEAEQVDENTGMSDLPQSIDQDEQQSNDTPAQGEVIDESAAARAKRQRPKAEDMFADSDEDQVSH